MSGTAYNTNHIPSMPETRIDLDGDPGPGCRTRRVFRVHVHRSVSILIRYESSSFST